MTTELRTSNYDYGTVTVELRYTTGNLVGSTIAASSQDERQRFWFCYFTLPNGDPALQVYRAVWVEDEAAPYDAYLPYGDLQHTPHPWTLDQMADMVAWMLAGYTLEAAMYNVNMQLDVPQL